MKRKNEIALEIIAEKRKKIFQSDEFKTFLGICSIFVCLAIFVAIGVMIAFKVGSFIVPTTKEVEVNKKIAEKILKEGVNSIKEKPAKDAKYIVKISNNSKSVMVDFSNKRKADIIYAINSNEKIEHHILTTDAITNRFDYIVTFGTLGIIAGSVFWLLLYYIYNSIKEFNEKVNKRLEKENEEAKNAAKLPDQTEG